MHVTPDLRAGPQPRIGTDQRAIANRAILEVAEWPDLDIVSHFHLWPEHDIRPDDHVTAKLRIHRKEHAVGIGQRHPIEHGLFAQAPLHHGLGPGQRHAVVDTHDIFRRSLSRGHPQALPPGDGDNLGQVVFALRIRIADLVEQRKQVLALDDHDPRIAEHDLALLGRRILELDDALERAIRIPDEPPVHGRIRGREAQHADRGSGRIHGTFDSLDVLRRDERRVGKKDGNTP